MLFCKTRSRSVMLGPITVFRPSAPNWPAGGAIKAAVLYQRPVDCREEGRYSDAPVRLGRIKIPPVPAPTFAVSPLRFTVNGNPLCRVKMPDNSNPPTTFDAHPSFSQ